MIAIEARRLGYRTAILDPDPDAPGAQVADERVVASLDDVEAVRALARRAAVVTVETEHVPAASLEAAAAVGRVHPAPSVVARVQDRLAQRTFLASIGAPQPRFEPVATDEDLARAVRAVGAPSILKTRTGGYDGKGQARLARAGDAEQAWAAIGRRPAVLEAFVTFRMEISALVARREDGAVAFYPVAENVHRDGILHTTRAPARIPHGLAARANELAREVADAMGHVGMMAVEMFVTAEDELLVNEVAPRVHNSGHYTLKACATSQFEQHLRAITGLSLGDTAVPRPAVMLNLLGDLWARGEPPWRVVLDEPAAHLHLYGKRKVRPGRKMGHIVVVHEDADAAWRIAHDLDRRLAGDAA